ncbi:MAG: hypothetical protein ACREJR_00440 [Candidatus Rokuibacteriota bacterium]
MIRGVAAVASAVALTLLVTWPLARCLSSCLGPPPDTIVSTYFLAWVARALTTPGVALLDAPMFAPYPNTLALGEYLPAYAPIAIPVIALTGNPVAAHGVILLALYTATALGVYALARRLLGADGPSAVAGVGFAYSARLLEQSYNLQTMAIAWVPWLFLALERFVDRPSLARAMLLLPLGLGLALSSMNMFAFTGVLGLVWLGVVAIQGRLDLRHVGRLCAVAVPGAVLLWAYVTPYRRAAQDWQFERTLAEVESGSTTLAHAAQPPPESLLHWALSGGSWPAVPVDSVLLGITLTVLAGLGIAGLLSRRGEGGRALAPYVIVGGVALVLAFGPTLHTGGGSLPLPYRALYAFVPGFGAIRTPARFLLYADLTLALLAGAGAASVLGRLASGWRTAGLVTLIALVLLEAVLIPFPGGVPRLDPADLPEAYRWLRTAPPGTVAVGVPMGDWVNVAASALHLRRTVNGWSSFDPPRYRDLVLAMETFPDARTLALVRGLGADVVILVDRAWLTAARAAQMAALGAGLRPERVFPTHVLYRASGPAPPGPESLRVEARVDGARSCVGIRNSGSEWVPLYPARRLTLWPTDREDTGARRTAWLPLDLAPGAEHVECLGSVKAEGISGTIDGADRRFRFAARPGQPASLREDTGR